MDQFPSSKFERGKIFTKAGLKVGGNYAKHHLQRVIQRKETDKSDLHRTNANELFKAFTQLRGTALKIAQSVSIDNSGMLPDEFIDVMSQAQYKVPPINAVLVREIVKRELGKYPEELFESFDLKAIAAASIGQVHLAYHKDFGKLAVKIQYPNVRETIDSDLTMAKTIFKQVIKSARTEDYFLEIKERLLEETNYSLEGRRIEEFHSNYANDHIATPRFISSLSSEKVLTMTFLEGEHLDVYLEKNPDQASRNHYGQLLWDFFHDQINENRTIHADAHPGNYKFMADGKLGILDFGCVKTFPKEFFDSYMSALPLHHKRDFESLKKLYQELGILSSDSSDVGVNDAYFEFFKSFGDTFIRPYRDLDFTFDNPEYKLELRTHLQKATSFKEPVGSRHFIYSARTHMGLYSMLMELKAKINPERSVRVLNTYLNTVE
jgi:predicted unusual protein kinase regulating ubiquinone biosynthesis (AarF/ABC1/UbiB family)